MFLILLAAAAFVNLIGALGPEVGFDALWYHLTIPKLYLLAGRIYHIPGGLLYYSEMPRLTEILYLFFPPHFLNWVFGLATAYLIYRYSRSLLAAVIWYATPLVGWLSTSAYVDLPRAFFEFLALILVLANRPIVAGIVAGLAISTKTLAVGSLVPLLILVQRRARFAVACLLVAVPWFLGAYLNTGYSFYPIGAGILDSRHAVSFNFGDFWKLFLGAQDPISPIYIIALPFLWPAIKKFPRLAIYTLFGFVFWFVTPRTGGGRFILPYLPAFAILVASAASKRRVLVLAVVFISLVNLGYRAVAVSRLTPYLLSKETATQYLCRTLDLKVTYVNCGNFKPDGLVYIQGYHNLYYVDFPFVHETWYRREKYNYVLAP